MEVVIVLIGGIILGALFKNKEDINGSDSINIKQEEPLKVDMPDSINIKQEEALKVDMPDSISVKQEEALKVDMPDSISVKQEEALKVDTPNSINIKQKEALKVDIPDSIELTQKEPLKVDMPASIKLVQDTNFIMKKEVEKNLNIGMLLTILVISAAITTFIYFFNKKNKLNKLKLAIYIGIGAVVFSISIFMDTLLKEGIKLDNAYNIVQTTMIPILTLVGSYLLYITIKEQREFVRGEKEQREKEELERRFYNLLDFHRKNIEAIIFTDPELEKMTLVEGRKGLRRINQLLVKIMVELQYKSLRVKTNKNQDEFEKYQLEKLKVLRGIGIGRIEESEKIDAFNILYNGPLLIKSQTLTDDDIIFFIDLKAHYGIGSAYYYGGQKGNLEVIFKNLKQISNLLKLMKDKGFKESAYLEIAKAQITIQEKELINCYSLTYPKDKEHLEKFYKN